MATVHMDQFPPLLMELLGKRWFQTGSLSLYFKYPTLDLEAVRCFGHRPDVDPATNDVQIPVWIDHENGEKVAEGTASVGAPDKNSAVQKRIASIPAPKDIRIFANLEVGRKSRSINYRISSSEMDASLEVITEPLPDYKDGSIWGRRIASPSMIIGALLNVQGDLLGSDSWIDGMGDDYGVMIFGSIELQLLKGPVFLDYDYEMQGSILAIGETPKTEYYWFDGIMSDRKSGEDIVRMMLMMRSMKESHRAWQ